MGRIYWWALWMKMFKRHSSEQFQAKSSAVPINNPLKMRLCPHWHDIHFVSTSTVVSDCQSFAELCGRPSSQSFYICYAEDYEMSFCNEVSLHMRATQNHLRNRQYSMASIKSIIDHASADRVMTFLQSRCVFDRSIATSNQLHVDWWTKCDVYPSVCINEMPATF